MVFAFPWIPNCLHFGTLLDPLLGSVLGPFWSPFFGSHFGWQAGHLAGWPAGLAISYGGMNPTLEDSSGPVFH